MIKGIKHKLIVKKYYDDIIKKLLLESKIKNKEYKYLAINLKNI